MKRIIYILMILIMVLFIPLNSSANGNLPNKNLFTEEELAFIKDHPTIRLGIDPEFIPYEFINDDGQYSGIAADYIELLSEKIGIQMIVEPDKTWVEAYQMGVDKEVDVLPCVLKTDEREQFFLFTDSYYTVQRVIIVQEDNTTINSLEDVYNTTVSVQDKSSHYSYLSNIPEINLSLYNTVEEGLIAVSEGNETAFVGNLATSAYFIKSSGISGLKYVSLGSADKQYLHFAIRKDWPLLVSIINKGLSSITDEERMLISDKWIGLESHVDYSGIIKTAGIIGSIVVIIFIISIFWILRLRKEIAKRISIEEELRRSKTESEVANQIKSSFLARMSHEIRTPLNAITGMAYLVRKSDITLSQKMYMDKITQASHNMLGIINDILDFSKIEAGKVEIENVSFHLDKLIQQVISIISYKIEEQGIGFKLTKEPDLPVYFIGDSKRIGQILLNLLNNSVKFTTSGDVSLCISLVSFEGNLYHLQFAVKDTGIGMSEEQIAQLFQPFSQADSSINRRFGGTGLGLSIVKSLVEMMNGFIQIQSTVGEGSTFTFQLPLMIDKEKDQEEKKRAESFYAQNICALVVINSNSLISLMETYLDTFGVKVDFVKSAHIAQQILTSQCKPETHPYDLIILDYDVLDEASFEFAKNILDDPQIVVKPKIIMLLPFMREDLLEKINYFGLNLGIAKPIIPSVLFDGIQEMFNKNPSQSNVSDCSLDKQDNKKASKKYSVLVVEDNSINQFISKSILEQVGINVILADNGEEGANYYLQHSCEIDLILMDLHMPVLNGYEATALIRKVDLEVPIVAMTADAITGIEKQCLRVGINHYISKPFDPDNFIDTILEILDHIEDSNQNLKANDFKETLL